MAGRIPRDFIDDLLIRVDIVDLIDSHVPLKKTGSNHVARCPFHDEKSPSFSVNRSKQFFYCFGCGAGGNAITFVMDYLHLEFVEAIEDLANFVGIDVLREESDYLAPKKPDNLKEIYAVLESTAKFYAQQLKLNPEGQQAIAYLKKRELTGFIARDFMLGYAPDAWNELSKRFNKKTLFDAGLIINKENGGCYDRFRGRLMFPIRDKRSRVIGFGARVLDDSLPKYLNSPETTVFSKGNEVYGLYELLQKNSKPERILIVEGYMDVIALAQFEIYNAVATLGTATSKIHFDILFRFSTELVLCFDGDKAGKKAAWRAVESAIPALKEGRQIKIMLLPQGDDPDTLVRKIGKKNFEAQMIGSQSLSNYFFDYFGTEIDLTTLEGKSNLINKAKPYLEQLPKGIFRDMMTAKLERLSEISKLDYVDNSVKHGSNAVIAHKKKKKHLSSARIAIALLIQNPHLSKLIQDKNFNTESNGSLGLDFFKNILQTINSHHSPNTGTLFEIYRRQDEKKTLKTLKTLASLEFPFSEQDLEAEFLDAVTKLIEQAKNPKRSVNTLLQGLGNRYASDEEKQNLRMKLKNK